MRLHVCNKRQKRKRKQQPDNPENWNISQHKNKNNNNETNKINKSNEQRTKSADKRTKRKLSEAPKQHSTNNNACQVREVIGDESQSRNTVLSGSHLSASQISAVQPPLPHLLLLALLLLICSAMPQQTQADWLMDCGDCLCKWQSGKKTADCKNLTLNAVPENLNNEVQVLDLSFNRIAILEQNAFLNADLHNLHKLFMRNASLQQIDPRTFTQLEILIEVDFSNNLLRSLQANVFARLVKVRSIVLNGNLLETLADGVFQNLKYLHKVELKHNRLTRIAQQAFGNVPLLSQIYLDGNRLSFLRKESFETLKRLTALSLDSNPWNCTCELQIFRDFVLKRNLYTPPTACYYPVNLRGMLWVEDQPEAFACKPRIVYPARGASVSTSKENVTLVCRVYASPNTLITWDYNKQQYRASTTIAGTSAVAAVDAAAKSQPQISTTTTTSGMSCCASGQAQRVHIQLIRDEQTKEKEFGRDLFISRFTIVAAEKSDEGTYTCAAENAGGKDAVQMSLLVQRPVSRDFFLQDNFVVGVSLMALGLLSVSAFLALVSCCLYKRFKAMSPSHHRHHHHHLDVADQRLSPSMDGHHMTTTTTTTVVGGTDVVLGMDNVVGSYKHHLKKRSANGDVLEGKGGSGGGSGSADVGSKYTEVIRHGGVGAMDNGGLPNIGSGGGALSADGVKQPGSHADKMYFERSSEETLNIKYPHGPAAVEINRLLNATSTITTTPTKTTLHVGSDGGKWRTEVPTNDNEGHLSAGSGDGSGGNVSGHAGEYQPDLLSATHNHNNIHKLGNNGSNFNGHANNMTSNQQGQLYSPLRETRTINRHDDQQMSQQHKHKQPSQIQKQQQQQQQQQQPIVAKSKYNINVQEYLQSRYGAASKPSARTLRRGGGGGEATATVTAVATAATNSGGIALTSTGSLPTSSTAVSAGGTAAPLAESGFSTLKRHSKSVALPPTRTPTDSHSHSQPYTYATSNSSYGYEYRQPPPPPYNSAHRTASGLQLLQRRTSITNEQSSEQSSAARDFGYREGALASAAGISSNYGGGGLSDGARQTIVTASPSLQFLTTTGYGGNVAPQRQLL